MCFVNLINKIFPIKNILYFILILLHSINVYTINQDLQKRNDESKFFDTLPLDHEELLYDRYNNKMGTIKFNKSEIGYVHAKLFDNFNKIVGCCKFYYTGKKDCLAEKNEGCLDKLYIEMEERHKKYGAQLFLWSAQKVHQNGAKAMILNAAAFEKNGPPPYEAHKKLLEFYKNLGGKQYWPSNCVPPLEDPSRSPFLKFEFTRELIEKMGINKKLS